MPSEYWSTMDCVGLRSGMSQLLRCYHASCMHLLCGGVWWTLVESRDFNRCSTKLWSRDSSLRFRHLWNCFVIALTWSCSPPSYETLIMFCTSSYHLSNIPPITFGLGRTIECYLMLKIPCFVKLLWIAWFSMIVTNILWLNWVNSSLYIPHSRFMTVRLFNFEIFHLLYDIFLLLL